jgi:glycosyltransferase involved in cell wall biosynthesis
VVIAIAPYDSSEKKLQAHGVKTYNIRMKGNSTNPIGDIILFVKLFIKLKHIRPGCVLNYTIKPNIYGGIACSILGIPYINNITGLGAVFLNYNLITQAVNFLYRIALRRSSMVFFQNNDDLSQLLSGKIVNRQSSHRLPGSGVNLDQFAPAPFVDRGHFTFLLFTRILWEKGIREYYQAAKKMQSKHPDTQFQLVGPIDPDNQACVPRETIQKWADSGAISYLGPTDNVGDFIENADCVVLPSYYREGVPRSLLESAAMGKPIITTDWPGCRDAVDDGVTGFLCRVRDPRDLATKMEKMIQLTPEERDEMGKRGREKMEREFDEQIVIKAYMDAIEKIFSEQNETQK